MRKFYILWNQFLGSDYSTTTIVKLRNDIPTYFREICSHSFIAAKFFKFLFDYTNSNTFYISDIPEVQELSIITSDYLFQGE